MKNKFLVKYIPGFMCAALLTSTIGLSLPQETLAKSINEKEIVKNVDTIENDEIVELFAQDSDFYKFLEGLEELPKGIEKQGPEKVAEWLTNKTGVEVIADGENLLVPSLSEFGSETNFPNEGFDLGLNGNSPITTFGAADCVVAWGLLIGTVGFPASKLLKLKEAIDLLGGISKTIDKIYTQYKKLKSENWRTGPAIERAVTDVSANLPKDVLLAFLDFFNMTNVWKECFSD